MQICKTASFSLLFVFSLVACVSTKSSPSVHSGTWGYEVDRVHAQAESLFESKDYATSLKTYKRLARVGDRYAMYRISHAYEKGLGVDGANPIEAWAWAKLSSETQVKQLVENEKRIWNSFNETQKETAVRRFGELNMDYSELAVALDAKSYTDKQIRNLTGSRVGAVNPFLKILRDDQIIRGEDFYGEFKETSRELKEYIGKQGSVAVRDQTGIEGNSEKQFLQEDDQDKNSKSDHPN